MTEHTHRHTHILSREQADLGTGVSQKTPKSILGKRYSEEDPQEWGLGGPGGCVRVRWWSIRISNLDFLQKAPPAPGVPPGRSPLGHAPEG